MASGYLEYATSGIQHRKMIYVAKNNDLGITQKYSRGANITQHSGTTVPRIGTTAIMVGLVAGDTLQLASFQDSGANMTYNPRREFDVYRIKSNMVPTGSVSGILIGIG